MDRPQETATSPAAALQATVAALVLTTQFTRADIEEAARLLTTPSSALDPFEFTPWTQARAAERLPNLASTAACCNLTVTEIADLTRAVLGTRRPWLVAAQPPAGPVR